MSDEHETVANDNAARQSQDEPLSSLFPNQEHLPVPSGPAYDLSSPVLRPQHASTQLGMKMLPASAMQEVSTIHKDVDSMQLDEVRHEPMDVWSAWDENGQLKSPEDIELDELQGVFDGYY